MITGLVDTLAQKGDIEMFFCVENTENKTLKSIPIVSGGWAVNDATNTPIAWISSEDLHKFFNKEAGH